MRYGLCLFRADAGALGRRRKSPERGWLGETTESVPMGISIYKVAAGEDAVGARECLRMAPNVGFCTPALPVSAVPTHPPPTTVSCTHSSSCAKLQRKGKQENRPM